MARGAQSIHTVRVRCLSRVQRRQYRARVQMKVLVCGGRRYRDWDQLRGVLDILSAEMQITEVIHGDAQGADRLAGVWARLAGIPERRFPADWARYSLDAGPMRNAQMLVMGKPDLVVAFPGNGGTRDMVERAAKAGLRIILVPETVT